VFACSRVRVFACSRVRVFACSRVRVFACSRVRVFACPWTALGVAARVCALARLRACAFARSDSRDDEADCACEETGEHVVGHDADAFGLGVLHGVDHAGLPDIEQAKQAEREHLHAE
jgi:hypothetical protein